MSATVTPVSQPGKSPQPTRGSATKQEFVNRHIPLWVVATAILGLVVLCIDCLFMSSIFQLLAGADEGTARLIALGFALTAALTATIAGASLAKGAPRIVWVTALAVNVGLGVGAAIARFSVSAGSGLAVAAGNKAAEGAAKEGPVAAALMLLMYLGSSFCLFMDAQVLGEPRRAELFTAERRRTKLQEEHATLESQYARVAKRMEAADQDLDQLEIRHEAATEELAARRDFLKHYARDLIAVAMKDPNGSFVVRQPFASNQNDADTKKPDVETGKAEEKLEHS